jgi:hypothetical protein
LAPQSGNCWRKTYRRLGHLAGRFPKGSDKICRILKRPAAEKSDHRHRWGLLRVRRERPSRRTAEQHDELAPSVEHRGLPPHGLKTFYRKDASRSLGSGLNRSESSGDLDLAEQLGFAAATAPAEREVAFLFRSSCANVLGLPNFG